MTTHYQKRFSQWTLNVKAVQLRHQFTSPTLCFSSLRDLFDYLPEPIKEDSILSRKPQQRLPPPTMRLPPNSRALHHRSLPHPDLRCYEATLQIHRTILLPVRTTLDPFPLRRISSSRYDQVDQHLSTTMKTVAKEFLRTIWYLWQVARLAPVI
jgi:hypothetical protein